MADPSPIPDDINYLDPTANMATVKKPTPIPEATPYTAPAPNVVQQKAPGTPSPIPESADTARNTVLSLSPDPVQADAKLQVSKAIGDWLKLNPVDVHQNFDLIAQHIYGPQAKGQPPTTILQKVQGLFGAQATADINHGLTILKNIVTHPFTGGVEAIKELTAGISPEKIKGSVGSWQAQNEIGALGTRQASTFIATGKEDDATTQKIADLQKVGSPAQHLGFVPEQLLHPLYGLGYQGLAAAEVVADSVASALTLEPIRKMIAGAMGRTTLTDFGGMAQDAAERFSGTMQGASYVGMRDKGIPPEIAAPASIGTGLLLAAVQSMKVEALPGMRGPEAAAVNAGAGIENRVLVSDLTRQAAAKATAATALKGTLGSTVGNIAKQGAVQGTLGILTAVTNDAGLEFATAINNLTQTGKLPYESAQKILTDILGAGAQGFGMGITMGALGEVYQGGGRGRGLLDDAVLKKAGEIDTIRATAERVAETADEAVKAAQEKAKAPAEPEHPITEAEKVAAPQRTVGDIMENEPSVPKVKAAEEARPVKGESAKPLTPEEEMLKANTESDTRSEDQKIIDRRGSEMDKLSPETEAAVRETWPNQSKEEKASGEGPAREAAKRAEQELGHPLTVDSLDRIIASPTADEVAAAKARIEESKAITLPRKLTEEQGRALDEATQSEEGMEDYIDKHPDVQQITKEIEDYQSQADRLSERIDTLKARHGEAIDAAKEDSVAALTKLRDEKNAKIDELKAAIPAAKKALREQIKTRAQQKQYLKDIANVDTSQMRPEFADPVNKILEEFTLENFNKNSIIKLNDLRDLIEKNPEMDVPKAMLKKLGELDKKPFKSFPPDGLKAIRDSIVSYAKAQADAQKVMFEGRVAEKDAIVNQIRSELPKTKPLKPGKNGEPATINAGANKVTQAKDSVRKIQDTVGQRAERIGLVADRVSPSLKKAVVDPLMEGHRGMDKTDSAFHAQFHELTKEITDVVGNLEPWLAKKETILLRDESLGALSPNESAVQSTPVNVNIDRAHRLAIYMHSLNPDNARHMIDGGIGFKYSGSDLRNRVFRIDEATVLKIQDMVRSNPEELKLATIVSDLLRNMGLEEAKVYLRENGIPLELVDNYYHIETMPVRRGMTVDEETISTEAKKQFSGIGLAKGRLQPRVESSIPIYINPITFDLAKSQEHNSSYINLEGPLRSVGRILRDRDLKESMANTVGETTHKILVKAAKDVAGMKDPASDMNNFWGRSKNRMTTGLMALPNVFVPLKQPAALSRYTTTGYVRGDYLVKGLVDSIIHPKTTEKTMRENSAFYDRRSEVGGRPETASVIKSQVAGSEYGGKSTWKTKAMQGIGWMETRGSVRPGMRGAVLQFLDDFTALNDDGKAISRGSAEKYAQAGIDIEGILKLPEQERPDAAMAAAYRYAEIASENTQTSGNPLLQSDIQRGTTPEQVLTSFMSEGFTASNMRRTAFLEGQRMGNVKGWLKVSGVFVGTLLIEPAYEMMVNRTRRAIMGTDNPDIKKEALYQFIYSAFGGIPIVNQVIQAIAAKIILGWNFSNNSVTPIDNLVNVGVSAVNGLLNPSSYKTVRGKTKLVEDTAAFLTALSGYAVLPGVKLLEGAANALDPSGQPKQPFLESVLQGKQK